MTIRYIKVAINSEDIANSLRVLALTFLDVADEIEKSVEDTMWQPLSKALKNGKTVFIRASGSDVYEPFLAYYDRQARQWRDSLNDEFVRPEDFVSPLEWKPLS